MVVELLDHDEEADFRSLMEYEFEVLDLIACWELNRAAKVFWQLAFADLPGSL